MSKTPQRGKRGRSPTAGALTGNARPHTEERPPTGAFHDASVVQQLPLDGRDTYAAVALSSVLADELLPVVREAQKTPKVECVPVDPAVAASWCVPHAVVPSVVAARVVMRFAAPDVALIGHGINSVVSMNARAEVQIEALHDALLPLRECRRYYRPRVPELLEAVLLKLCGVKLRKVDLERLADVLSRFEQAACTTEFLATWCQFRLGTASLDSLLGCYMYGSLKAVFGSQVAVDEFFLPTAPLWTLERVKNNNVRGIFNAANIDKLATLDFRDQFFLRLASTPESIEGDAYENACQLRINKEGMSHLTYVLYMYFLHKKTKTANVTNVFLDPRFAVDFCAQALRFVDDSDEASSSVYKYALEVLWQSAEAGVWSVSIAEIARDSIFVPAVACANRLPYNSCLRVHMLTGPLEEVARDPSCAALFCTADFCDNFFSGLTSRGPGGWFSTRSARRFAGALANIAAAVPRAQRQALFATEQFRDQVMAALLLSIERGARDLPYCPELVPAARAALLCIAEMDDGSLHEVFAVDTFRAFLASHDDQREQSPVS